MSDDLSRILGHIRDALSGREPAAVVCMDREDAETILRAIAERDAALRPFAASADGYDGDLWNETEDIGDSALTTLIKVADLRRARDILGKG